MTITTDYATYSDIHPRSQLRATIEGFQLVLIGAANELPVLHLSTEKFSLAANDWSSDVSRVLLHPSITDFDSALFE
jgi:hypothetical protein